METEKLKKNRKHRAKKIILKGSSLVMSMAVMGIILVISLSLTLTSVQKRKSSSGSGKSVISYQKADEAVETFLGVILKKKKEIPIVGDPTFIGVDKLSGAGGLVSEAVCDSTSGLITFSGNVIEMLEFNGTSLDRIFCNDSTKDIESIHAIRSLGSDLSGQTQRSIQANLVQNSRKTILLLHFDGTEGSNVVFDSSRYRNDVKNTNNLQLSSSAGKFGSGLVFPNNNSDKYLEIDESELWRFKGDDFTLDFWFRDVSFDSRSDIVCHFADSDNYWRVIYDEPSGSISFEVKQGGSVLVSVSQTDEFGWKGTMHHFALVRNSGNWYIYKNGKPAGESVFDPAVSLDFMGKVYLGKDLISGFLLKNSFLDELRIYRSRYWSGGSDFTPSTDSY